MTSKKLFYLTSNKLALIGVVFVSAVILHNVVYALFKNYFDSKLGGDEPFFFLFAVIVIPLYLSICLIYSLVYSLKHNGQ